MHLVLIIKNLSPMPMWCVSFCPLVVKNIFSYSWYGHSVYPNISLPDHIEVCIREWGYHSLLRGHATFSMHDDHVLITWYTHAMDTWHLLNTFQIPMCDGHMTLCWPHFELSLPKSRDGSISVSAAQTEIDPKMATQADSLFGSIQTLVSHVFMTTQGCVKAE